MKQRVLAGAFAVCMLALVPLASGARATFPGGVGQLVFQSNRDGNFELYVVGARGANARKLFSLPDTDEFNAAWSPSGRRLVYQTGPPSGSSDIALANADGSGRRTLVGGPTDDRAPQFCSENTVVFTRQESTTNSELYAIGANGTGLRRLTDHPATDSFPTCSPRGDRIAFISGRDGPPRIYEIGLDGGNARALADAPSLDPDYSPNGTSIAYVAPDPSDRNLEVFTKNLSTGEVVQRTTSSAPFDYRLPKFTPAGAGTVLATYRNRQTNAEAVQRVMGGAATTLVDQGSGAVQQPRPPCLCDRLGARIHPYFASVTSSGMRVAFSLTWEMTCTEGAGTCQGRLMLGAPPGDRAQGLQVFRVVGKGQKRTKATAVTCVGPCSRASTGATRFNIVGGRNFSKDKLGKTVKLVSIEVERFCERRRAPQTFTLVFLAGPRGPLDIARSDLNGNGIPDGRERRGA